ncbi:hypothetical protein [Undibacterium sp. TS12]|uniref:hypothetical protein n=1 Tax=Undibacterium sp. TS12 TaxID=2908202 RepID=UPI001F4C6038|nr:hypothetical protein [Undibacterium sp. TS12]MCH8623041.1 hypothetical protein [Undibacterium sp. TS12]
MSVHFADIVCAINELLDVMFCHSKLLALQKIHDSDLSLDVEAGLAKISGLGCYSVIAFVLAVLFAANAKKFCS